MRNGEVLHTVKEEKNKLHKINRGRLTGLVTSFLLKNVYEGKVEGRIEVTRIRVRRSKQLPYDLKK